VLIPRAEGVFHQDGFVLHMPGTRVHHVAALHGIYGDEFNVLSQKYVTQFTLRVIADTHVTPAKASLNPGSNQLNGKMKNLILTKIS
jgi:hypothetical protein